MKKIIVLLFSCFLLTGCSLIPRITMDTPNTLPQSVEKSKAKYVCKGNLTLNTDGSIKSCSKGFYSYSENYGKKERRMTIVERVKSFFNMIFAWGIPGLILICVFIPGAFTIVGAIIGRLFEGAYGIGSKALKQISIAVQKVKPNSPDLIASLKGSTDEDVKKFIEEFKRKNNITKDNV